ncbi:MAG: FKBP-type peptidyl-prolyl cis-trans isomerase [Steroidobacteraceae bacterium]
MKHTRTHHTRIDILRRSCGAWLMMAAAPLVGAQTPSAGAPAPADSAAAPPGQAGYLFGLTFGEQLHNVGISDQVAIEDIERGLKDGLQGKKSTPADRQQVQEFVRMTMATAITRNQAAAKDFLARNGHEKGVVTTASGLEYRVVAAGDRKAPAIAPTDTVTVQYRGKLLDGSEFDSSYTRGQPATFPVNGVIPGWQEAMVLMKPGAKWTLFVPPELAYGASPRPGIPGGSLLIFDVELLSAKSNGPAPAPAQPPAKSK